MDTREYWPDTDEEDVASMSDYSEAFPNNNLTAAHAARSRWSRWISRLTKAPGVEARQLNCSHAGVPVGENRSQCGKYLRVMPDNKWDARFLLLAHHVSSWSKDPRRKVGCVMVDNERNILATGYNGFPRGVADNARLDNQHVKRLMIVHAEANAVAAAARNGHYLKDSTAYVNSPPCAHCAALLIQAGVRRVIFSCTADDLIDTDWTASQDLARAMFAEANIPVFRLNENPSA
jgi:dCMP deaminase